MLIGACNRTFCPVDLFKVWVVLSYNDKPNAHHESLITRGMFVLKVAGDAATLESATEAWSENDVVKRPLIGSMAVVPGAAR